MLYRFTYQLKCRFTAASVFVARTYAQAPSSSHPRHLPSLSREVDEYEPQVVVLDEARQEAIFGGREEDHKAQEDDEQGAEDKTEEKEKVGRTTVCREVRWYMYSC